MWRRTDKDVRVRRPSPDSEVFQRQRHSSGEHHVLQHDVIAPMARERRVGAFHRWSSLAASFFFIVVLLSHSLPAETVLRCSAENPLRSKNSRAVSLASTERCGGPRALESFSTAS